MDLGLYVHWRRVFKLMLANQRPSSNFEPQSINWKPGLNWSEMTSQVVLRIRWKGFEWEGLDDRGWAIRYEHNNVKISSREEPRLLRIKVKKISETEAEFSAPNFRSLKVKLQSESSNKVASIHIFGQDVDCEDIGDEAADWASEYIGKRSRIR